MMIAGRLVLRIALGILAVAWAAAANAQKAALVENVDEPGRSPYQSSVVIVQNSANCPSGSTCTVHFPAVPAGKRLVVTYAGAEFTLANGVDRGIVSLAINGNAAGPQITIPVSYVTGNIPLNVAGTPVTFYVEAGNVPTLLLRGAAVQTGLNAVGGIAGYLVSVP
jgi:hypothetical protein